MSKCSVYTRVFDGHLGKCTGRSDSPASLKLTFSGPGVSRTPALVPIEHVPRQMLYKGGQGDLITV